MHKEYGLIFDIFIHMLERNFTCTELYLHTEVIVRDTIEQLMGVIYNNNMHVQKYTVWVIDIHNFWL